MSSFIFFKAEIPLGQLIDQKFRHSPIPPNLNALYTHVKALDEMIDINELKLATLKEKYEDIDVLKQAKLDAYGKLNAITNSAASLYQGAKVSQQVEVNEDQLKQRKEAEVKLEEISEEIGKLEEDFKVFEDLNKENEQYIKERKSLNIECRKELALADSKSSVNMP